jgi:cytochrome c-type biogenesis protein
MDVAQLFLAFTAGALAFLSPCSLPMLPVYIAYYLDRGEQGENILKGFLVPVSMISGFLLVYLILGVALSFTIAEVMRWLWVTEPVIGVVMVVLGVIVGGTSLLDRLPQISLVSNASNLSTLAFGVAYAVASLGCSFPVFMLVVFQGATVNGPLETLSLLSVYGAGAATLVLIFTLGLILVKGLIYERIAAALRHMKMINAAVLIAAGLYMIYRSLIS